MKKWILIFAVVLFSLLGLKYYTPFIAKPSISKENAPLAERFIRDHLMNDDGRIATGIKSRESEYLSETIGLFMEYLVLDDDQASFDQQVDVLKKYFLTSDGLVSWELKGKKKGVANAFIDDLRIMNALYEAGEKWSVSSYLKVAQKIENALVDYQINENLFVDYVDIKTKDQGQQVTLSYLIPSALDRMKIHNKEAYEQTRALLLDASNNPFGFFPKTYNVPTHSYIVEIEANMIDQLYMGYHRAQWGGDVTELVEFIRQSYSNDGKLFGRYDFNGGKPVVEFESVAVYALGILLAIEVGEEVLATELYESMKDMQQMDPEKRYYGGYIDIASESAHPFDNLLALIAERKGYDEGIF